METQTKESSMKKPDIKSFKHIAIIQTAFLGDVVLTLPLAHQIKVLHPDVKLSFITTPQALSIAECASFIDKIISYDKRNLHKGLAGIKELSQNLKDEKIDCIIAPHRSLRTSLLTYYTNPKFSISFKINALSILYKCRIPYVKHFHEINRNLKLLGAFSGYNNKDADSSLQVSISIPETDKNYNENQLLSSGIHGNDKIIIIAPGSIWKTKRWKTEHFIKLCQLLRQQNFKPVLIGSADDSILCDSIASSSGSISFAGKTTITQTLHLMQKAVLTVTNDSAPTHFAGLVGCTVIAIFGPTSPIFGFGPAGTKSAIIENQDLNCRPCAIHGGKKCPLGTHECMASIKPEDILAKIVGLQNDKY
jgi:heptosyltransferase II